MHTRTRAAIAAMILAASGAAAAAFLQPDAGAKPAAATQADSPTIRHTAILTGTWRGEMHGDVVEEHWSAPVGNHVIGMFRWMNGAESPSMLEILSITQEQSGVVLRLRHFDSTLTPWASEKDAATALVLNEATPTKLSFKGAATEKKLAGVTYELKEPGSLTISVEFPRGDDGAQREPLVFTLKKVAG